MDQRDFLVFFFAKKGKKAARRKLIHRCGIWDWIDQNLANGTQIKAKCVVIMEKVLYNRK